MARTLGRLRRKIQLQFGAPGDGDLEELQHLGHQARKIHRCEDGTLVSGVGHQLADDLRSPNGYRANLLDAFPQRRVRDGFGQLHFGLGQDAAQHVIKVVGDSAAQHSEAFQLLPFEGLGLRVFLVGDIDIGPDIAGEGTAGSEAGRPAAEHPPVFSVRAAQPVLQAKIPVLFVGRTVAVDTAAEVFGVYALGPRLLQIFVEGVRPVNFSQVLLRKETTRSGPVTQIITGAVSAMWRKRSSLSRNACSVRTRSASSSDKRWFASCN